MTTKFCIDIEVLRKQEVPVDLAMFLISLYYGKYIANTELLNLAGKKGYLVWFNYNNGNPDKVEITDDGVKFVESLFLDSEFKPGTKEGDRFSQLAEKLRAIYPEGRKNCNGTSYNWRDSNALITKRLKALVKKYGDTFTDEQAIEATKRYVASFNGNYKYMQLLKYFIFKNDIRSGELEESSQLLSYIENTSDTVSEPKAPFGNFDWDEAELK